MYVLKGSKKIPLFLKIYIKNIYICILEIYKILYILVFLVAKLFI